MLNVKNPADPRARIWLQALSSALTGGVEGQLAVLSADHAMLAYDARFGTPTDDKLNALYGLDVAVKYYERHALTGRRVVVKGVVDAPPLGSISDFRDDHNGGSALVKWESGAPKGEVSGWVRIDQLQLIAEVESKPDATQPAQA